MAGLKELIDMESIEDQPTSSVPKNKSDYTEPYDPSMARGLAGIAVVLVRGPICSKEPYWKSLTKNCKYQITQGSCSTNQC